MNLILMLLAVEIHMRTAVNVRRTMSVERLSRGEDLPNMSDPSTNQSLDQLENGSVRFGLGYVMVFTAVCCITFGLMFGQSIPSGEPDPVAKTVATHDLVKVVLCLVFLGIVGVGKGAFLLSFHWVGRICACFGLGGLVATLAIALASVLKVSPQNCVRAGWLGLAIGCTLGVAVWAINYRRRQKRIFKTVGQS